MSTICANCFAVGHFRKDCRRERVSWLDYIKNLGSTGRFTDDMFGRWIGILRAARPEIFEEQQNQLENIPEINVTATANSGNGDEGEETEEREGEREEEG